MRTPTPWDLPDRLRNKIAVDGETDCWLWLGARQTYGHGRVKFGGKLALAYRAVYELLAAEIPDGLTLDHLCLVPACVNPRHLEPVTLAENVRRAIEEGRKSPTFRCGHPRTAENTQEINRPHLPTHRPMQTCLTCDRASQLRHGLKRNAERRAQRATREQVAA